MSTKLLDVVEWTRPFVSNIFLLNDNSIEPATTNANILLGTILSPPFKWEWNRNVATMACVPTVVDIPKLLPDFGFLESAYLQVPALATADENTIYELTNERNLEKTSQPGRPTNIMVFLDDQAGNITFRLGASAPEQAYPIGITYQKAMVPLTKISAVVPIPDKLMHIFRYGFLALAFLYTQDGRFAEMNQKFIATLLGAQQGLNAMQRNIFLGNWFSMMKEQNAGALETQQGTQARGAM